MGANYDIIIVKAGDQDMSRHIADFLLSRGFTTSDLCPLESCDIDDDQVTLLSSPSQKGFVQIVVNCNSLGIALSDWLSTNPLAVKLSEVFQNCVHAWSFDSGYFAGYSVYFRGRSVESDYAYFRNANSTQHVNEEIELPKRLEGQALSKLVGERFEFAAIATIETNLEIMLARLISRFGFDAQLIDFHEAIDEHLGIRVSGQKYEDVQLTGWTALRFSK